MTAACGAPPPKVEEMRAAAELLQWEADPKAAGLMTATGSRPESGWAGAEAAVACPRRHGKTHTNSQGLIGHMGDSQRSPNIRKNKGRAGTIRQCSCVDSMEMLGCLEHSACSAHACMVTMGTQGLTQTHRDPQRLTWRHRAAQRLTGRQRLTWRQGFSGSNNAVGSHGQEL